MPNIRDAGPQESAQLPTDAQLLNRYLDGRDEAAFGELTARHAPPVLRLCRKLLASEHDAEDASQIAFQLLHLKASKLSNPEAVGGWLLGTAYKVAVALRRRSSTRARVETEKFAAAPSASPGSDEANCREASRILMAALKRLPKDHRTVILLCYMEGLTNQEAAQKLGLPLGTVKTYLARARISLRGNPACRRLLG